ncbi:MAG TPA: gluconokinase, partial [Candidatus Janibacter merdipullorum]|nr:gluconokinase [Candidatus Janibacter merdipullorum]
SAEVIAARLKGRRGHFMPASLLQSQIDTLEELDPDEDGVVLDLTAPPAGLIARALEAVREGP